MAYAPFSRSRLKASLTVLGLAVLALLVALVVIVGASWLYFEPNSRPRDEAQATRDISAVLTALVEHRYDPLFFRRDTHSKTNACVKATFTIDPAVAGDPRLNVGVFKGKANGDRSYKAWLRFSNSSDVPTDDRTKDFRGLAIKLFGVEGEKPAVPSGAAAPQEKSTQD